MSFICFTLNSQLIPDYLGLQWNGVFEELNTPQLTPQSVVILLLFFGNEELLLGNVFGGH